MGVGAGSHDTHLNNSVLSASPDASAGRTLTRTGQWPLQVRSPLRGAGPPTCPHSRPAQATTPRSRCPSRDHLGAAMPRIPGQGPQTPSTIPLRSSEQPLAGSASRWSPGRPRPSELRRWPGTGQVMVLGSGHRIWPHRRSGPWLLPMADLDSVLVQEIGRAEASKTWIAVHRCLGGAGPVLALRAGAALWSLERHSYCGPNRMLPGAPGRVLGGHLGVPLAPGLAPPCPPQATPSLRRKQGRPAGAGPHSNPRPAAWSP